MSFWSSPRLCGWATLAAAALGGPVAAAPQEPLAEVVVAGTRLPPPERAGALGRTVIVSPTPRAGADLGEALRGHPDLFVESASVGSFNTLTLRGGDPNFVVVALEGVPLNDPANTRGGAVDLSAEGAGVISSIEIVRGAQSSVYGSGALSGLVNIRLPDPHAGSSRFAAALNSRSAWNANAVLDYPWDTGGTLLALEGGGQARGVGGARREAWATTLKITDDQDGVDASAFARLSGVALRAYPDDSGGPLFARGRSLERRDVRELVGGGKVSGDLGQGWRFNLDLSGMGRREAADSPGVTPGVRDPIGLPASQTVTRFDRWRAVSSISGQLAKALVVVGGVQLERAHGETAGAVRLFGLSLPASFAQTRTTVAAFGEGRATAGPFVVELGLRRDAPDDQRARTTGRAVLTWTAPDGRLALYGAAASGFKAPSFYALGNPLVGNPALRAERGEGFEVGAIWRASQVELQAGGFRNTYRDLIDFDPGPPPRLVNRARVNTRGGFVDARLETPGGVTLQGGVTYARTRDAMTGEPLRGRPTWRASAGASMPVASAVRLHMGLTYVDARRDSSVPTGDVILKDYALADLSLVWSVRPETTVELSADNVLGADYQNRVGFPGEDRSVGIRISQTF